MRHTPKIHVFLYIYLHLPSFTLKKSAIHLGNHYHFPWIPMGFFRDFYTPPENLENLHRKKR